MPPSPSTSESLPSITEGSYRGGSYDVNPAPRTAKDKFNVAHTLAPSPGGGRSSYPSPPNSGQYSSESRASSDLDRRSSYASHSSSTMTSARESPNLPPMPSYVGSHAGAPLEASRDPRLPPMYPNAEPHYGHPASVSPPRPSHYPPGYDQPGHPEYGYVSRPPYGGQGPSGHYPPMPMDQGGDYDGKSQKRRRGNLPKQVTDILRTWFQDHVAHPYPTEDEKQQLMVQTGLTLSQKEESASNAQTSSNRVRSSRQQYLKTTGTERPLFCAGSSLVVLRETRVTPTRTFDKLHFHRYNGYVFSLEQFL